MPAIRPAAAGFLLPSERQFWVDLRLWDRILLSVAFRPKAATLSIESHSQLPVKMRTILIKYIWHLRCFSHLLLTAQPFSP